MSPETGLFDEPALRGDSALLRPAPAGSFSRGARWWAGGPAHATHRHALTATGS